MKPNVMIVGPTSTGKSRSIINLDPETTVILNMEAKALPFRGASRFKRMQFPKDDRELKRYLHYILKNPTGIEVVVIDSFVTVLENFRIEAKKTYKGFDVWEQYNNMILDFFILLREFGQKDILVYLFNHDLLIQNAQLDMERVAFVEGNKWKGKLEKEFTIVLHTKVTRGDDGKMNYQFVTNNDGERFAKSPEEMFDLQIPNDLNYVKIKINEYEESTDEVNESSNPELQGN